MVTKTCIACRGQFFNKKLANYQVEEVMPKVSASQISEVPQNKGGGGLAHYLSGTLGSLACKCSPDNDMDFLIKQDRIVCASCGNEILCLPPLVGVCHATCNCCVSISVKSTFVLDSRGIYTCTWCGRAR
jgi:hypothetical protein